jgi:hypothetical protein
MSTIPRRIINHHHPLNIKRLRLRLKLLVRLTLRIIIIKILFVLKHGLCHKCIALVAGVVACRAYFEGENVGLAILSSAVSKGLNWGRAGDGMGRVGGERRKGKGKGVYLRLCFCEDFVIFHHGLDVLFRHFEHRYADNLC